MPKLDVWLDMTHVGALERDVSGNMWFTYQPDCQAPISLSMPLREEPYPNPACEAFFGGLLPESDNARQLIGKRFGVNGNNSFSLLSVIGHECAGAITLVPEGTTPAALDQLPPTPLSEAQLAAHIRDLPKRPLLAGVNGIRLSLAGAGDKAAVCVVGDQVALPADGMPTTHILKPDIADVGDTVANEFFCMRLAERIGLQTAPVLMAEAEEVPYLLVTRYDRKANDDGTMLHRLHQEDFCQALGISSANKYQNEGGPGYQSCLDVLRRVRRPAVDRIRMTNYIIFNFLVGNMDAHGKNFSLLHQPTLTLAPLYDVLCTRVYERFSTDLAMKVDKYYDPDDIFPRHWQRFCQSAGIAYPQFRKEFTNVASSLPGMAEALRDELVRNGFERFRATFDNILTYVATTCATTVGRFAKEKEVHV